jgi:hypothetical protein
MKWTALALIFIYSFNALAIDQGSLLVCRAVVDTAKRDNQYPFDIRARNALLDALRKYDTKVGMFLKEGAKGEVEFDPQYSTLRSEQIDEYYKKAKAKAAEYNKRSVPKAQLLKEKESLMSDLKAVETKYRELGDLLTTQDKDPKIKEIIDLQELEFQYNNRASWNPLTKAEKKAQAEAKVKHANMMADPETFALWREREDTRSKKNETDMAIFNVKNDINKNIQLLSNIEYYKPNAVEAAIVQSEVQGTVLDSVIDLAQKVDGYKRETESESFISNVYWIIEDMAKTTPATISFLLAELEAAHGKEMRLLKNSMEAKAIEERDKKIARLEQQLVRLESQSKANASDITSVKNDIKNESSSLKSQIETLSKKVEVKYGFWGVVIVSIIIHHFF